MKFIDLGSSGTAYIKVSKLALGTARYGNVIHREDANRLMDLFTEAGGNCIDTARVYAEGKSEEIVGQWMKERGNRHEIVISSKCCSPEQGNDQQSRLTRKDMENDLNASLKALQTEYIDIYWIYKDDPKIST